MPNIPIAHQAFTQFRIRQRQDVQDQRLVEVKAHLIKTQMEDAAKTQPRGWSPIDIQLQSLKRAELEVLALRSSRQKPGRVLDPAKDFWFEILRPQEEIEKELHEFYEAIPPLMKPIKELDLDDPEIEKMRQGVKLLFTG